MADIKLCYFDFRGLAEVSRLVLALAGQKYEDVRWSREDWPKYKPDAPFGQGPWLEYQGKKIAQSAAIACFLAREFGLYGKTNWDAAVIDQVIHIYKDLVAAWQKSFNLQGDEKAKVEQKQRDEEFPKFYGHFVKLLKDNGSNGHFVGNSLSLADLYVHDIMLTTLKSSNYDAASQFPELQTLKEKVEAHPRLQAYIANRKDTPY